MHGLAVFLSASNEREMCVKLTTINNNKIQKFAVYTIVRDVYSADLTS